MVWRRIVWWSSWSTLVLALLCVGAVLAATSWLAAHYTRQHPLNLAPYLPRIEAFLASQGLNMTFGQLELFYDESPVLRAESVQIKGPDGQLGVFIERAAIRLANRNLWRLQAAPKAIEAEGATLRVVRLGDKIRLAGFEVSTAGGAAGATEATQTQPQVGKDVLGFLNNLGHGGLWGRLKDVRVKGLNLLVRDDVQLAEWVLENADFNFSFYPADGAQAAASATLRRLYGGREMGQMPVEVRISHLPGAETARIQAKFTDADVKLVADYLPATLQDLLQARGQIELATDLSEANTIGVPWITLRLNNVAVQPPRGYAQPLQFRRLVLSASYAPSPSDVLTIRQFDALTPGGLTLFGRGRVVNVATSPYVDVGVFTPGGKASEVFTFFPSHGLQTGQPLKWVEWLNTNIQTAHLTDVRGTFRAALNTFPHCGAACGISVSAIINNGALTFLPGLPPVQNVQGRFRMAPNKAAGTTEIWVEAAPGATLAAQAVSATRVGITNIFHPSPTHVQVFTNFAGPVSETLHYVNQLAVREAKAAGRMVQPPVPGEYTGQHSTFLALDIPMFKGRDAALHEMGMRVSSSISAASIAGLPELPGVELKNVAGTVSLTSGALDVRLRAGPAAQALNVNVSTNILPNISAPLVLNLTGTLPPPVVANVLKGASLLEVNGAVGISATLTEQAGTWGFTGNLNAGPAAVNLPLLNYSKPSGQALLLAGQGRLTSTTINLANLNLTGPGVNVRGSGRFNRATPAASSLGFPTTKLGRTDVALNLENSRLSIRGAALDVSGDELWDTRTPDPNLNLNVALDVKNLYLQGGRLLGVAGALTATAGVWDVNTFTARLENTAGVRLSSVSQGGVRKLSVGLDDVGRTLSTFGVYDKLKGGTLAGEITFTGPGQGGGLLYMDKFELLNPPTLVQLLGLVSLQQLVAGTDSTLFDKARIPIRLNGPLVELNNAVAEGPSLSLKLNGTYHRQEQVLNIDGSLAPALPFNRLVAKVPLFGTLLTGSQDGLVVADFKLKGPAADPQINVRPLSILTPGLIKDVFRGGTAPPPNPARQRDATP